MFSGNIFTNCSVSTNFEIFSCKISRYMVCVICLFSCVYVCYLLESLSFGPATVHYHLCCTSCRGGFQQTWCCPSELHHCFDRFMYLHAWCRLDHLYRQGRCRQQFRVVRSLSRRCSRCGQPRKNSLLPSNLHSARCGRCTCTGGWPPAVVSLQVCLLNSALCRELVCMWYGPVYGYKCASCLRFDAGYLQKKGAEIHAGCV